MRDPKEVNILVVDDEAPLRSAIVFDFKRKGFNVFDAENGRRAFDIVKDNKIDVVLTDVRMPGGDGIELLDNVKKLNPELPVVMFITGFADITLEDAYDKGVDAVFSKPFDRKLLLEAVMGAVSERGEKWSHRKHERVPADFDIDMSFADFNVAMSGSIVNLGRGGMFVSLNENFPTVNDPVKFKFLFDQGAVASIHGEGIVRWVRVEESQEGPTGCGIEFDFLSEESRVQVVSMINKIKTRAYIPKS